MAVPNQFEDWTSHADTHDSIEPGNLEPIWISFLEGNTSVLSKLQPAIAAILLGGLIAGTIDIAAAALINDVGVTVILRAIASGIMGKAAFTEGVAAAWLGLLLQWGMSILIAAIFVFAGRTLRVLRRRWIASGLVYGVGVFFTMNYVVLPLSALRRGPHFTAMSFVEALLAMLLFGLIISFFARDTAALENTS